MRKLKGLGIVLGFLICLANGWAQPALPTPPDGRVLNVWNFQTTNWTSLFGESPVAFTNLSLTEDWAGYGLLLDDTNAASLSYPLVSSNGWTNLNVANGSVEFWFSPDWDSGTGAGNSAVLLQSVGDTNAWTLAFSPDGSTLAFSVQASNYLAAPITWYAGDWHHLALTYSSTNTALYLEGAYVTNGSGIPDLSSRLTNTFSFGSDATGLLQARGVFNQLITYDYSLDSATISNFYAYDSQNVFPLPSGGSHFDASPPSIGYSTNYSSGGVSYTSQVFGSNDFWLEGLTIGTNAYNSNATNITLLLHGTQPGIVYQLLTAPHLPATNWTINQTLIGAQSTNVTPAIVASLGGSQLFFRAFGYTLDSDGDGLPDWWELQYGLSPTNADTGNTGIPDGYKQDSAGDGYNNLQKYQMGIAPNVFVTPAAPAYFTAISYSNGNLVLSWNLMPNLPASGAGAVTGYTIQDIFGESYTVGATVTNYTINIATAPIISYVLDNISYGFPEYTLTVNYQHTNSQLAYAPFSGNNPAYQIDSHIVRGPGGRNVLVMPYCPPDIAYLSINETQDGYKLSGFNVPVSQITNGIYVFANSTNEIPVYTDFTYDYLSYYTYAIGTDGGTGPMSQPDGEYFSTTPFLDGTVQMQQNATFLLEAASQTVPIRLETIDASDFSTLYNFSDSNYVSSGYFLSYDQETLTYGGINEFQPFLDNACYRNAMFTPGDLNPNCSINTGIYSEDYIDRANNVTYSSVLAVPYDAKYQFDPNSLINAGSTNAPAPLLTGLDYCTLWYDDGVDSPYLSATGSSPVERTFLSNVKNYYGIPYSNMVFAHTDSSGNFGYDIVSPGTTFVTDPNPAYAFFSGIHPNLQISNYYFFRSDVSPTPAMAGFSNNVPQPLVLLAPNSSFQVACWAREAVVNGHPNLFAYVQQYFDQAYLADTNGNITTNQTGVLSEYGDFFPTQSGLNLLVTRTNALGQRSTNLAYVVGLCLDANHDGVMNQSIFGPDFACPANPFNFWVNNDYDRFTLDSDDGVEYDDSVQMSGDYFTPNNPVPDYNFKDGAGHRSISCDRDLEDFTRLWIAGITTNLLTNLPSGSTITLSWGDVGSPNTGNPTIDLFVAADADGGIGYLTNSTTAFIQADNVSCPYVGRLGPGQSIQLNNSQFANNWAGNHFIWCGVTNGNGALTLTIADGSGNTLAQTTAYIQIVDIKQMYERWTVGDAPGFGPLTNAIPAEEGVSQPFQYGPPTATNTPYILYVHGWNMQTWEKDRFAESAFKRLYWQGYQGRFGSFRWPTESGFKGISTLATNPSEKDNYDRSEYTAWKSATGLLNKLNDLNAKYSGHVYMLAHSMGNVVAGEALRLSGSSQVVNTYVASQGAISAHTYDTNIVNYSFSYAPWSVHADPPNIYGNRFLGNNGGGAGQIINFYNTNDFALQRSVWQLNQLFKPDQYVLENGDHWDYGYNGTTNDVAPWNNFYKEAPTGLPIINFDIVNVLTNHYEVMGLAAQSWTTALGATPSVQHVADNIYLGRSSPSRIWPIDTTGNNYAAHFWHSAEFRGDYWQMQSYWSEILGADAFGLK